MSKNRTFKEEINRAGVRRMAAWLQAVHADFPRRRFMMRASRGLDDLELKARVQHVIRALDDARPDDYARAVDIVERAAAIAEADSVFLYWPLVDWVAHAGLHDFDRSMAAMRALQADPSPILALLERLKDDPAEYVRRFVANNLDDIAKDHPDLELEACASCSRNASSPGAKRWCCTNGIRSSRSPHAGTIVAAIPSKSW